MTVQEMIERLQVLADAGKGEYTLFDSDANPIISANPSDDDIEAGLNRVYIEAEF